jgi:hypothetical protein
MNPGNEDKGRGDGTRSVANFSYSRRRANSLASLAAPKRCQHTIYSQERWWATLTSNYQVCGRGVDEPADEQTFAEETRQLFRLKIGFNF